MNIRNIIDFFNIQNLINLLYKIFPLITIQESQEITWQFESISSMYLYVLRNFVRGNQACREYTKHVKSGEEKYQKSHRHGNIT